MTKQKKYLLRLIFVFTILTLPNIGICRLSTSGISEELEKLSEEQIETYREIGDKLRCPTCTGLSVLQSDSPFSLQIRNAIITKVKEGDQKKSIIDFFKDRYGYWILREPPTNGTHSLAWLIPLGALLLGLGSLYLFFKGSTKRSNASREMEDQILQEMNAAISHERARIKINN